MEELKKTEEQGISVSEFAIASLVMGILSFIHIAGIEKAIVAVVFGILAKKRINANSQIKGKKLAISGIVLGILSVILVIVFITAIMPTFAPQ